MNGEPGQDIVDVGDAGSLAEGEARKFEFQRDGISFEGIVIRVSAGFFAYENRCRHLPLPLDHGSERFFTTDEQHLVCSSHGALYEPTTGKCVRGPCEGARLKRLDVAEVAGRLRVSVG